MDLVWLITGGLYKTDDLIKSEVNRKRPPITHNYSGETPKYVLYGIQHERMVQLGVCSPILLQHYMTRLSE